MTTPLRVSFRLPDPDSTARLAVRLAHDLRPGDVVLLSGTLGAGKTHFARALIQERLSVAGLHEDVPSPTFTLVQVYDDGKAELWHADLYRLSDMGEVAELGLDEAFESAICLVEWPDRLGELTPHGALSIEFAYHSGDGREVILQSDAARWKPLMDAVSRLEDSPHV